MYTIFPVKILQVRGLANVVQDFKGDCTGSRTGGSLTLDIMYIQIEYK